MKPFDDLIASVRTYRGRLGDAIGVDVARALDEVEARLGRLTSQYPELLRHNDELLATDPIAPQMALDPTTGALTIKAGDQSMEIKLKPADPAAPITMSRVMTEGAYQSGTQDNQDRRRTDLMKEMERSLEDFYQSAHRVQKLLQRVVGRKKIPPTKTAMVRNHLVEHPTFGQQYTFGYTDKNGPRIRPFHTGTPLWVDEGLVPNVQDFVAAMKQLLV
jgi:hypothetical protein